MSNNKYILLICLVLSCQYVRAARVVVDQIVARVNGTNILQSDLKKMRVSGKEFTLEEAIDAQLYLQEASKRKILPTNVDLEKYIASLKTEGITDGEFERQLDVRGFTLKSYKAELARSMAESNLLHYVVKEKIFVSAQEVEKYHQDNPIWLEDRYLLKTTIVPFEKAATEKEVEKLKKVDWVASDWINKSEIDDNMAFIFDMKKSERSKPVKTDHGFQLVMLYDFKPRALKSVSQRYTEIEKKLHSKRVEKFEDEFKKELRSQAYIVRL